MVVDDPLTEVVSEVVTDRLADRVLLSEGGMLLEAVDDRDADVGCVRVAVGADREVDDVEDWDVDGDTEVLTVSTNDSVSVSAMLVVVETSNVLVNVTVSVWHRQLG